MIEIGCSVSVFLFWLERRDLEIIALAHYETIPQKNFLGVRSCRKSLKTFQHDLSIPLTATMVLLTLMLPSL